MPEKYFKELQKAHINNAYYIGRCGELEAKLDTVRELCELHKEDRANVAEEILDIIKLDKVKKTQNDLWDDLLSSLQVDEGGCVIAPDYVKSTFTLIK